MKAIRWLLKLVLVMITLPLLLAVWLAKWLVAFLHHCSTWIFYLLGSVLLATAVLSFLMQQSQGVEALQMLAVNDIEKAFSHGNPWLMKFRAISIPETLERAHLKEWLDHVWIVDFEQVEVILQESEWKRFFPEEWLNNGEEDCNGKKE